MAYGPGVTEALAITSGGGGSTASGPSGAIIVVLLLIALVGLPVVVGLALRWRDARRSDDGRWDERRVREPPESPVFGGSWGRTTSVLRRSTRGDWLVVAAFAAVVLVVLIVIQL